VKIREAGMFIGRKGTFVRVEDLFPMDRCHATYRCSLQVVHSTWGKEMPYFSCSVPRPDPMKIDKMDSQLV